MDGNEGAASIVIVDLHLVALDTIYLRIAIKSDFATAFAIIPCGIGHAAQRFGNTCARTIVIHDGDRVIRCPVARLVKLGR